MLLIKKNKPISCKLKLINHALVNSAEAALKPSELTLSQINLLSYFEVECNG